MAARFDERDHSDLIGMLDTADPAAVPDCDWPVLMAALKASGIPYEAVDEWNRRDPDRYDERENRRRWDSFEREGGATVGSGTAFIMLRDAGGVPPTKDGPARPAARRPRPPRTARPPESAKNSAATADNRAAVVSSLSAARGNEFGPDALAFLAAHGLDEEAARRHGIVYTPTYRMAGRAHPALVIPYPGSPWYYAARMLDVSGPHKYDKPKARLVGPQPLWNPRALKAPALVVCEGQLDAVAVAECGLEAVALGSNGSSRLVGALRSKGYAGAVVLMLDADDAGMDGCARLADELDRLHARECPRMRPAVFPWPDGAGKDPGEWYARDPEGMRRILRLFVADLQEPGWADAVRRDFSAPTGGDALGTA